MTDTGQVPGEGLPENAGRVEQPGVTAPEAYTYLSDSPAEDEDLLLPGAQGAWGNEIAPPAPEPVVETVHQPGPHETAGRDSGSVDLNGVRLPEPSQQAPAAPRRPLHLGPPMPDLSTSPVRSLADRGPADLPARQPGPPTLGPEYLDVQRSRETAAPQVATAQTAGPWAARGRPVRAWGPSKRRSPGGTHGRGPGGRRPGRHRRGRAGGRERGDRRRRTGSRRGAVHRPQHAGRAGAGYARRHGRRAGVSAGGRGRVRAGRCRGVRGCALRGRRRRAGTRRGGGAGGGGAAAGRSRTAGGTRCGRFPRRRRPARPGRGRSRPYRCRARRTPWTSPWPKSGLRRTGPCRVPRPRSLSPRRPTVTPPSPRPRARRCRRRRLPRT